MKLSIPIQALNQGQKRAILEEIVWINGPTGEYVKDLIKFKKNCSDLDKLRTIEKIAEAVQKHLEIRL